MRVISGRTGANWSKEAISGHLNIVWGKLGINPANAKMSIPNIQDYQENSTYDNENVINIEGGKGFLIVIDRFNK